MLYHDVEVSDTTYGRQRIKLAVLCTLNVPQLLRIQMTSHAVMICNAVNDVTDTVSIYKVCPSDHKWVYERRQHRRYAADYGVYEQSGNNGLFRIQALPTRDLLHILTSFW